MWFFRDLFVVVGGHGRGTGRLTVGFKRTPAVSARCGGGPDPV